MLSKKILSCRALLLFIFILLPSFVAAQTEEYRDYVVEKGDTLWDISQKELNDYFLWPKVWKENPDIKNPDRIYPKQTIRIPLYLLQKEIPEAKPEVKLKAKPEIKKEESVVAIVEPAKKEYLVPRDLLISSGYITDSVHSVGRITDSPVDRTILGKNDHAYIRTKNPVEVGNKFYIINVAEKVSDPKSGRKLGYLIEILGIAEVVDLGNNDPEIIITNSYRDIPTGSLLDDYYEIEPPLAIESPRKPDLSGYVVATREIHMINGSGDVVYIDIGKKEGLEVGDLLATTAKSKHRIINGTIQVINTRETTSTAIVRKSNDAITKGDGVTGIK